MGLYSRNMEEWVISDIAALLGGITSVCFYDTLGSETTEFIVDQTLLKTIACTDDKIAILSKMKNDGKIKSLTDLIVYTKPTEA